MRIKRKGIVVAVVIGAAVMLGAAAAGAQPATPFGFGHDAGAARALGTAFNYQGQLKNGGAPVNANCDFQFALYDALALGARVGTTQTVSSVAVANGLFSTAIDFGSDAFNGEARFLSIQVRCPAGSGGTYTALGPRQALTPAPYALALPGLYTEQGPTTTNIIAGFSTNRVTNGALGATIGGGGASFLSNTVGADFGTVSGGASNRANGYGATVAGGGGNSAINEYDVVGGGLLNHAAANRTTIGGGEQNFIGISGTWGTIGGGAGNQANGTAATVPGGLYNNAFGDYSFAAGNNATANHQGTFVWADSSDFAHSYISTGRDQFDIRATNGVSLAVNAGPTKTVSVGERYRDNGIVAWAKINGATGNIDNVKTAAFGIAATRHIATGQYGITTTASANVNFTLIPLAVAEIDSAPAGAANVRIVSVNQVSPNYFEVYIDDGNFALVDNDFTVIVTGR